MRRYSILLSLFFLFINVASYSQGTTKKSAVKWTTNPFDHQVFIENNGQFDGKINSGEKILYGVQLGHVGIYFTANKVIYRYDKNYFKKSASDDPDDIRNFKHEVYFLSAEWKDANKSTSVIAKNEKTDYYTYGKGANGTIKANLFRQIVYQNLYPGVDVVYQFIPGKDGIKYSLVVHPGANLSNIKINYSGAKSITKNAKGDILINSDLEILKEHAPVSNYEGEPEKVAVSSVISGTTETFNAGVGYDKSKVLVIDPWQTDPLFTPAASDEAYDLDWDYQNNVYAYGGDPRSVLQLVRLNSAGVIQWTYNASAVSGSYYGDFCVDKRTQTCYIVQGFSGGKVLKVSPLGALTGTFPGSAVNELWRCEYDQCNGDVVIGAGGTSLADQAGVLDTNMSSINPVNVMGVPTALHDVSLMAIDPNGSFCYMASACSVLHPSIANDIVMQMPLPTLSPTTYMVHEQMGFEEVGSVKYVNTNAMNGMAASPHWLYLYNGDTVTRNNKNTGTYVSEASIRTNSPYEYGGIDVDDLDNLYIGVQDTMYIMDSTYKVKDKILLHGTVFDIRLGQGQALYACGVGFVSQLVNPISQNLVSSASGSPSSCSACDGRASVTINAGIAPYKFLWSNGGTNQTDTGLCAGLYSVVITDASCPPKMDTIIVNVVGKVGYGASVKDSNPACAKADGEIIVNPFGGATPYTYLWSNGATTQKDTGLIAGSYTCMITDNAGCKYEVFPVLRNPETPVIYVSPPNDSLCRGSQVTIKASGAKGYLWSPHTGLSCYNCASPIATPTTTTTYTVLGSDSNGCTATQVTTIRVASYPKPVITGKSFVCPGYSDTLTVKGGNSFVWSNADTSSTAIIVPQVTETITVAASNSFCTHDTSFVIHTTVPAAIITASADSVCKGGADTLTASGGITYKWSTQSNASSIIVHPVQQTTYTLYAKSGTCTDSTTITIGMIKQVGASLVAVRDSICPGDTTTISAISLGTPATGYLWNTGATTASIVVNPQQTTTYSTTLSGKCNTAQNTITVNVIPLPVPVITGDTWKCHGVRDTLHVSGGYHYKWNSGKTTTTYITGGINRDSTVYVTVENKLGCAIVDTFHIALRLPPTVGKISPAAIACAGIPVSFGVTEVSGQGPYTYSWSPGGQTTDSITTLNPDSATLYTVYVSNGCLSHKTITITPDYPVLNACCNQTLIIENDTTTLTVYGTSTHYQWLEANQVLCLDALCDSVRVTPKVTTTYTVIGTDKLGCETQQLVTVIIDVPCFNLNVPNVLTPNFAGPYGKDNEMYIKTDNIDGWAMTIYDRWGKEVYTSTNQYQYWDGKTEGGSNAPDGVYYYVINATCQNTTYKKEGFVQLIR